MKIKIKLNQPVMRRKMLKKGYTVAALQRHANVSSFTMYNAINKGGYIRVDTAKKLADALQCDIEEIVLIEGKEPTEKGA